MRAILWVILFAVGVTGVTIPAVYFWTANQLPSLESEYDLEKLLRHEIESDRMGVLMATGGADKARVKFVKPDFSKLPKDLVGLYISQRGCPTYFQTPREEGAAWGWRMFVGIFGGQPRGDGWCERLFAWRLADRIGAKGTLQLTIAAHKLHAFLQKDQLIAYDLASIWFEEGVIGVEESSRVLFRKALDQLTLSELGEFMLALPPHNYYAQVKECQNPSLIRQNRDYMIHELANDALVAEDRAKHAVTQPLACTKP